MASTQTQRAILLLQVLKSQASTSRILVDTPRVAVVLKAKYVDEIAILQKSIIW